MRTLVSNSSSATPNSVALGRVPNLLCLTFLICNLTVVIGPALLVLVRIACISTHTGLRTVPGKVRATEMLATLIISHGGCKSNGCLRLER